MLMKHMARISVAVALLFVLAACQSAAPEPAVPGEVPVAVSVAVGGVT